MLNFLLQGQGCSLSLLSHFAEAHPQVTPKKGGIGGELLALSENIFLIPLHGAEGWLGAESQAPLLSKLQQEV